MRWWLLLALGLVVAACGGDRGSIVVGSLDTDEGEVLAHLYSELLDGNGIDAEAAPRTGDRDEVLDALDDGHVDLYPEYAGAGLDAASRPGTAGPDVPTTASALRRRMEARGLEVFDPSLASPSLAVVVTFDTAEATRVFTVSGLAERDDLVVGVLPGCARAPACLPGMAGVYGLRPERLVEHGSTADAVAALHEGDVTAVVVPITAAELAGTDDVVLLDDRRQQPSQNVLPVVGLGDDERKGAVYRTLDRLAEELTTADVRELNRRIRLEGEAPDEAARDLLEDRGLVS